MKEEMKKWEIEFRDGGDYGCGQIVEGKDEREAVQKLQLELIEEDDFMSKLVSIMEVEDQEDAQWSIEGGPELDQEDKDTLNYAMDSMFNDDGESLRESMEKASKNK